VKAVADAAAKVEGVKSVLAADDAAFEHWLPENVAPLVCFNCFYNLEFRIFRTGIVVVIFTMNKIFFVVFFFRHFLFVLFCFCLVCL
jgi:hypothetical protein